MSFTGYIFCSGICARILLNIQIISWMSSRVSPSHSSVSSNSVSSNSVSSEAMRARISSASASLHWRAMSAHFDCGIFCQGGNPALASRKSSCRRLMVFKLANKKPTRRSAFRSSNTRLLGSGRSRSRSRGRSCRSSCVRGRSGRSRGRSCRSSCVRGRSSRCRSGRCRSSRCRCRRSRSGGISRLLASGQGNSQQGSDQQCFFHEFFLQI